MSDNRGTSERFDATASPTRVIAQGTFDLLHPGHIHYLRDAKAFGDELHVIVARRQNVTHKAPPVLSDRQRLETVSALKPVDEARLGHPDDIFVPIEELEPDVIVLGYDQHHDADAIRAALDERRIDCRVERASAREPRGTDELCSTGAIIERILERRG